jgi:hypothetical protein
MIKIFFSPDAVHVPPEFIGDDRADLHRDAFPAGAAAAEVRHPGGDDHKGDDRPRQFRGLFQPHVKDIVHALVVVSAEQTVQIDDPEARQGQEGNEPEGMREARVRREQKHFSEDHIHKTHRDADCGADKPEDDLELLFAVNIKNTLFCFPAASGFPGPAACIGLRLRDVLRLRAGLSLCAGFVVPAALTGLPQF